MAEFPYLRPSVGWEVEVNDIRPSSSPAEPMDPTASTYCAYNQTRQRFLCVNIESANFSATDLDTRLLHLSSGSDAGIWIAPIQKISPTNIRVPLDLIYLDSDSVVLDAVESFPLSQPTARIGSATSMLALPAQTIGSTGTQIGDRLLLCAPAEMKQRLHSLSHPNGGARSEQTPASCQEANAESDSHPQKMVGNLLPFLSRSSATIPGDAESIASALSLCVSIAPASPEIAPIVADPIVAAPAVSAPRPQPTPRPVRNWKAPRPKSWFKRLLSPEPSDPRKASRTELSWLVAYFFTGGRSIAHAIRDISVTGMYVFTQERWYPGTVVRMTLTDKRNQISERSFTINAEVVRSTDDGVGFRFVLKDAIDPRDAFTSAVDLHAQGVYRVDVEAFLLRISTDTR